MRPRHYAEDIAKLTSLEERREALKKVPEHLRAFVQVHLLVMWNIKRQKNEN